MRMPNLLTCSIVLGLMSTTTVAQNAPPDAKKGVANAGQAKQPKGKLRFTVDGTVHEASESRVQCMFVGMGGNMAQGMVLGGKAPDFKIEFTFFGAPVVGDVPARKGSVPTISAKLDKGGVSYLSAPGGQAELNIQKVTKDGNNAYIAAKFNATLKSQDGKTVKVTDGTCESAYL